MVGAMKVLDTRIQEYRIKLLTDNFDGVVGIVDTFGGIVEVLRTTFRLFNFE